MTEGKEPGFARAQKLVEQVEALGASKEQVGAITANVIAMLDAAQDRRAKEKTRELWLRAAWFLGGVIGGVGLALKIASILSGRG